MPDTPKYWFHKARPSSLKHAKTSLARFQAKRSGKAIAEAADDVSAAKHEAGIWDLPTQIVGLRVLRPPKYPINAYNSLQVQNDG